MNWKKRPQTQGPTAPKQANPPARADTEPRRAAAYRFQANVFTWTGPGVENIFIDFDASTKRRKLRKEGDADGQGEVSERRESNA